MKKIKNQNYKEKFKEACEKTLFSYLSSSVQGLAERIGQKEKLSFQNIRKLCELLRDFEMWQDGDFKKANSFKDLQKLHTEKCLALNCYKNLPPELSDCLPSLSVGSAQMSFACIPYEDKILGDCPAKSEGTLCCRLQTLDVIRGCAFECSYCSIDSFFSSEKKIFFEESLKEKLLNLNLNPETIYHIGTGQSSDSLLFGNEYGILDDLISFAKKHPRLILEFKTKSSNIDYFLEVDIPRNLIVTWSLNPDTIISHEEKGSAVLFERLEAAKKIAEKKILVGFHFHPMFYYQNFKKDYQDIAKFLMANFRAEDICMISMGTLTYTKKVMTEIRKKKIRTQVLKMPFEEIAGKFSYPYKIKQELFSSLYSLFSPWHDKVFFYFCMEDKKLSAEILKRDYKSNEDFEEKMKKAYLDKIEKSTNF